MTSKSELFKILSEFSSFVITTHKNCDGDGLGAGLALYHSLKQKGKKVDFLTLDEPSSKYHFLDPEKNIQTFHKNSTPLQKDSLLIAVDTNDSQLIEPLFSSSKNQVLFIDHHPLLINLNSQNKKIRYFIDTKASSTGEIIFYLMKDFGITFNEKIATALYTSIVFDTKMFRSIKNSSVPFAISAELIPYISDVNVIYNHLFKNLSINKLNLFSELKDVEYYFQNSFSLLSLTKEVIKKHEAGIGEACELLDLIMNINSVKAAVLIFESEQGFKLSFRSADKSILSIAEKFDGGGHHLSGGAFVQNQNLEEIKTRILSEFSELLEFKKAV